MLATFIRDKLKFKPMHFKYRSPLFITSCSYSSFDFILAHIAVDYLKEGHYPGTINVGSRILRLGNKSMTTGYGLFIDNECKATAECVNIYFRPETRETLVVPADIRARLEADPMQTERGTRSRRINA